MRRGPSTVEKRNGAFFLEEKSSGAMFMNIDESRTEKMLKKS